MEPFLKNGLFITFEGGEGAGKTTLIQGIARELANQGYGVVTTREPGGTKVGEEVRHLLLHRSGAFSSHTELCLFLASRAQHVFEVIGPALQANQIVLCDRFNDSSIAYQGAARGLGMEKVAEFCRFVCQGVEPRLTLYLDIEPQKGLERAKKDREPDRMESETLLFHHRIREAFLEIHKANPSRFHLLDATLPPQDVLEEAMRQIYALVAYEARH